ncbi:MAG: type II toxin-antitoxin system HicB family antitoxin [candidate division NC10 bacterium]
MPHKRVFTVLLERDEDGYYMATVPELPGCHTQARSLDQLEERVQEAVVLYLEAGAEEVTPELTFVGLQRIEVDLP